ncbi:hypothetical protein H6CHR_03465 [Variovorax sp. PBL-H6]|uniref:DUF3106 domain-containing protein n=1 Tax=Variovorax sp. PBL-H6 TaxID=434009 RepID=UPI001319A032|nr:DUF3106 domain-containing protein [Variovorax sp. PBL-H6]VTU30764.1 hypothetical protein H6CHR_03465 [Variovorax sp. PBL-H6]
MPPRPRFHAPSPLRRLLPSAIGGACVLLVFALAGTAVAPAGAQVPAQGASSSTSSAASKPATSSKPLWRDLSARQQRALEPLALHWNSLTEPHKRKWLALSRNYAKLSPAEQETLHSRMTEWATLSNQQRSQARLNFADVKQIPVDERKAKWEAYQALSEEEKRELAARAKPRPGAAVSIRPVPEQKLVVLPTGTPDAQHTPRIQLAPQMSTLPSSPARPSAVGPAVTRVAAPTAGPPVAAEAQVPAPSAPAAPADASISATSPVRTSQQPPAAP